MNAMTLCQSIKAMAESGGPIPLGPQRPSRFDGIGGGPLLPVPVILLNGPPGSGKDTAAKAIQAAFSGVAHLKFAGPVKDGTHALFGLNCGTDAFEKVKDIPSDEFGGLTPRQAYIEFSERAVKPTFGVDRFGKSAARLVAGAVDRGARMIVFSDSGFAAEAEPVADLVGRRNVLLIRIQAEGRGKTFAGDSRSYIYVPGVTVLECPNNGPEHLFRSHVANLVATWLALLDGREPLIAGRES
jgi:hypothetical protein